MFEGGVASGIILRMFQAYLTGPIVPPTSRALGPANVQMELGAEPMDPGSMDGEGPSRLAKQATLIAIRGGVGDEVRVSSAILLFIIFPH